MEKQVYVFYGKDLSGGIITKWIEKTKNNNYSINQGWCWKEHFCYPLFYYHFKKI
nr:DUF226 domain-containing protein [Borrelia anserina]